jgi:hypothetical protein
MMNAECGMRNEKAIVFNSAFIIPHSALLSERCFDHLGQKLCAAGRR